MLYVVKIMEVSGFESVPIKKAEKSMKPKILQNIWNSWEFYAILGNPQIFSAMAMVMSIYRTLCVLVHFQNFFS